MIKKSHSQGFAHALIAIGLVITLLGALGFIFWQNFFHKESTVTKNETIAKQQTPTGTNLNNWLEFSEPTLGLTFKYPNSWGESQFEIMNPQPDELNKTFYKISFESKNRIITITPKGSLQASSTTMASLKESIKDYPESSYALVNASDHIAILVSDTGNQASALYAAKLLSLPKIDADTIVLKDSKEYGSSASCKTETYVDCYSDVDQSEIKLFLQELKAE